MFRKLTAIEPVSLEDWAEEKLHTYAEEVVLYRDIPENDEEIIRRIGDSDAVLVSYTTRIGRNVIEACPQIRYIGMCCSLYSEESANVDIACARERGIRVLGIRDYGDRGVVEFVLSELVRFLHGFDRPMLYDIPTEITGLKAGIIGLGVSGTMIAEALQFMGAEVSYFSRTRKPEKEAAGFAYRPLKELLAESQVVFACLNKNDHEGGYFICDTAGALGDTEGILKDHPNVICAGVSAGRTRQAFGLLSEKVLDNIETCLRVMEE